MFANDKLERRLSLRANPACKRVGERLSWAHNNRLLVTSAWT